MVSPTSTNSQIFLLWAFKFGRSESVVLKLLHCICWLLDESCSSLLSWNILMFPFGQCLTLSAKMAVVHEGTLRRRKSRPDHRKPWEKCFPKANSFQIQRNVSYFYILHVKWNFPVLSPKNKQTCNPPFKSYYSVLCYSESSFLFIPLIAVQ